MTVKKSKSGYKVTHCRGKSRGKTIAKHPTKKEALAQHRAIQANKGKGK